MPKRGAKRLTGPGAKAATATPAVAPRRGRPPGVAAASHEAILDAVFELLQTRRLRDLTIEAIAARAGVGKPTLYKWWPSKAALVMDLFQERLAVRFATPRARTAEQAIRAQVAQLIRLSNGFFGRVLADIIAEGQADPAALAAYRERYMRHRRAFTAELIARAYATGEFKRRVAPAVLTDMIYGPIYYRLLVGHEPLDARFGTELVDHVMAYVKADPRPRGTRAKPERSDAG